MMPSPPALDRCRQFGESDVVHAPLDDGVLDTKQFGDAGFHDGLFRRSKPSILVCRYRNLALCGGSVGLKLAAPAGGCVAGAPPTTQGLLGGNGVPRRKSRLAGVSVTMGGGMNIVGLVAAARAVRGQNRPVKTAFQFNSMA